MRTENISSIEYSPNQPPSNPSDLQRYLIDEFQRISAAINALSAGHLDKSYAAPEKPRDGDIRYADGTTWNPGSGIGVYRYNGSAWVLLG
ncbi:hypothetical protein V2P20_09040 [Methylobacter sp. Wu1]|uniref:hypothetical protein n=1 Tax=Methylobacter sp. Wu1 TaxID=3119359 RepID=UPI002F9251BE